MINDKVYGVFNVMSSLCIQGVKYNVILVQSVNVVGVRLIYVLYGIYETVIMTKYMPKAIMYEQQNNTHYNVVVQCIIITVSCI